MNELERVRSQAVGQEVDQELMERYPVQSQEKMEFPTRYGTVTAYVYRPFSEQEKLPVLINFHGGGFVKGYRGRDFGFSRILAVNGQCLVVDVDYKIAPEYKYPYAVEEGCATYRKRRTAWAEIPDASSFPERAPGRI